MCVCVPPKLSKEVYEIQSRCCWFQSWDFFGGRCIRLKPKAQFALYHPKGCNPTFITYLPGPYKNFVYNFYIDIEIDQVVIFNSFAFSLHIFGGRFPIYTFLGGYVSQPGRGTTPLPFHRFRFHRLKEVVEQNPIGKRKIAGQLKKKGDPLKGCLGLFTGYFRRRG